jgi:hypothetical protein
MYVIRKKGIGYREKGVGMRIVRNIKKYTNNR